VPYQIRLRKCGPNGLTTVTENDMNASRIESFRSLYHMREHRPASQRLQNLRQARMHTFSLACRQYYDRQGHERLPQKINRIDNNAIIERRLSDIVTQTTIL
jgi:hypothetical protein